MIFRLVDNRMPFTENDSNAQILRNFIDFSTKSNQFILTNLRNIIPEVLNQNECYGEAKNKVNVTEGIQLVKRDYKLNNIDIAYLLILTSRGYKFRSVMEKIYLCEDKATSPDFEKFSPAKPKISDNFQTKTAILNAILDCQEKTDEELVTTLVRSVPELLEKAYGVLYTGRFLSINEWIQLKEKEGTWVDEEVFRYGTNNLMPWVFANILVLQARGWYLQEIPEQYKGSEYILIKK